MGRADQLMASKAAIADAAVADEIEEMNARPDDMPADVWHLVQENGRLATEKLNAILSSPRFARLRPGDQAKLIALAQNRAYGQPKTNSGAIAGKRRGLSSDVTATELRDLASRTSLPEYSRLPKSAAIEDAVYEPD